MTFRRLAHRSCICLKGKPGDCFLCTPVVTAFDVSLYHFSKFLDCCNRHTSIPLSCMSYVLILFDLSCYHFQLLQSLGTIKGSYSEICQESKAKVSKRQSSDIGNMCSYIVIIAFTVAIDAVFILCILLDDKSNYSRILIGSYDKLEDRRIDNVINNCLCFIVIYLAINE